MLSARRLALTLLILLTSCQDPQRQHTAELEARIQALEQKVGQLEKQLQRSGQTARAQDIVTKASAQNCANDLAFFLETTRQDTGRYPSAKMMTLPPSCQDLGIDWQQLEANHYRFVVKSGDKVLATQSDF